MPVFFIYKSFIPNIIRVQGITLFPFVFLAQTKTYYQKRGIYKTLLLHELAHVKQVKNLGFLYFYISYGLIWCKEMMKNKCNLSKTHSAIPYEIEAYESEKANITVEDRKMYREI